MFLTIKHIIQIQLHAFREISKIILDNYIHYFILKREIKHQFHPSF